MLRPRGMGIMDFIAKTGSDLITPPQASPVFQGQTPLQTSMGRPEVQFSQPSASTMATSYPSGMAAMASPTPQVQAMMRGQTPERIATVTPPQVASARPQMLEPNRMMGQRGPIGSGVMQEGVDREKMIAANKIAEVEAKNPELKADPSFQDRIKGLFGDREKMLGLALAFNSMRLRPDTGLATIIGSELKDIRDTRKLQAASTRTAEYFKGIGRQDLAGLVENQVLSGKDAIELSKKTQGSVVTAQQLKQKYPDADIEDGLYNLKPNGTITKVGGGGVSVQVGGPEEGKLSTDYTYLRDSEGNIVYENGLPRAVPVPGSPAAQEAEQIVEKEVGRGVQRQRAGGTVIQDIQRGLDLIPELSSIESQSGVIGANARKLARDIEGTTTNKIHKFKESALSNVGLDTLQQMRENSPTGGALGQVPIQQQQRLEQVLGSLDVTQELPILEQNMKRVINIYLDIVYGSEAERALLIKKGELTQQRNSEINTFYYDLPFDPLGREIQTEIPKPDDVDQEIWDAMKPEQKALWR